MTIMPIGYEMRGKRGNNGIGDGESYIIENLLIWRSVQNPLIADFEWEGLITI